MRTSLSPRLTAVSIALAIAMASGRPAHAQTPAGAPPRDSAANAAAYLEDALQFVQHNAVDRNTVDWPRVLGEARARARGATSEAATYPAIRQALAALGDGHSRFLAPDEAGALLRQGAARGFGFRAVYPEGTVVQVYPGGPADRAGLHVGDTVKAVNGKSVAADVRGALVDLPGDSIRISVARGDGGRAEELALSAAPVRLNLPPAARRLRGSIGYVLLPEHLGPGEIQGAGTYADLGQDAIRAADSPPACGWIVDLRRNGGGNLWPMLAAVGPVLGEGTAGAFVGGERREAWSYRDGGAVSGGRTLSAAARPYRLSRDSLPVAVFTSRVTASSGEALAVSFRGRPNVRSFGEPTQGIPTANTVHRMPDGAVLVLTTAVDADRAGHEYRGRLVPDVPVAIDWRHLGDEGDPAIRAAVAWLRQQGSCRGR